MPLVPVLPPLLFFGIPHTQVPFTGKPPLKLQRMSRPRTASPYVSGTPQKRPLVGERDVLLQLPPPTTDALVGALLLAHKL